MKHPEDETLSDFSLGRLAEAELTQVSVHLENCNHCCQRLDQLSPQDRLVTRLKHIVESPDEIFANPTERRSAVRILRRLHKESSVPPLMHSVTNSIGDYDILGEVGRGGMGVVYKARHRGLQRLAALKMVLAGEFASSTQELRFRLEAELAARVQHPNIVQVYEVGSYEGRPFLALEWIEGGSLADRLDGKPSPPDEAAALVETLARAIDVAHAQGVVHRDLKPANILMQRSEVRSQKTDGEQANGPLTDLSLSTPDLCPKITDFGLAQTREGSQTLTQTGILVGTPGYMAPEQASGNRTLVGPATDVYALGVILFELCTGQLPFQKDNTLDLLRAVTSDEPPRPRRLLPRLSRDLEAIVMHCLEKAPAHRYPTALALAEDLERFQAGKPVSARPVGTVLRLVRAGRRRPVIAILMALLVGSLFAGVGGVTWEWLDANEQRDKANANSLKAEAEKQAALYQAYRACIAAAGASLEMNDVADAARHLENASESLRGWEWRHLNSRLDDSSEAIAIPYDETFLVVIKERIRIGIWTDSGLRFTNTDGSEPTTIPLPADRRSGSCVAQTTRGLRIASWDGQAYEVRDETGHVLCRAMAPNDALPSASALSHDGEQFACSWGKLTDITIYDANSGQKKVTCKGNRTIWSLAFSPDGTRLASGGEDRLLSLWNTTSGELQATCPGHSSKIIHSAFSPDGTRVLSTSSDCTVRQWDAKTGHEIEPVYDRHAGEVYSATYSPDGQSIASTSADRTVRIWSSRGRQDLAILHGHRGRVVDVVYDPSGRRLASVSCKTLWISSSDNTVRVWDFDHKASLPILRGHTRAIHPLTYSPDGRWLATGSRDQTIRLWNSATGEGYATYQESEFVRDLAFVPNSTWLITTNPEDSHLRIWDTATGRIHKEIASTLSNLQSLAVQPDGRKVASTGIDPISKSPRTTIFDIPSGKPMITLEGSSLAYSPDGLWLAMLATDGKTILLRDAKTLEIKSQFTGHDGQVRKGVFNADSQYLATGSLDKTVRLWHLETGECRVLRGHTDEVYSVAFHPDGTRLAAGCLDGTVWLWDLQRGEAVMRLLGHISFVWSLAFSPDGSTLATGSGDRTVRLWDTAPLKERYKARRDAAALRRDAEK